MSFSKTFSMTGWRLGYIIVPEMYEAKCKQIAGMAAPRPPTFLYAAGEAALNGDFKYVDERVAAYDERRKYFCPAVNAIEGLTCDIFEGSFYAWFDAKSTGMGSQEFCDKLAKAENLYFSPGHTFGPGTGWNGPCTPLPADASSQGRYCKARALHGKPLNPLFQIY